MTTTPDFTLDWPHGWESRDRTRKAEIMDTLNPGGRLIVRFTEANGFQFVDERFPNGRQFKEPGPSDLINAVPTVTHEMAREALRKLWDAAAEGTWTCFRDDLARYITQWENRDASVSGV